MNFIPETIVRAVCWTLLHSLWQGLVLAVVAGAVMLLTKRAKSSTRYAILGTLVVGFLAVSGYTFLRELRMPGAVLQGAGVQASPAAGEVGGAAGLGQATEQMQRAPGQPNLVDQLVQYFNAHAAVVVVVWFIAFLARFVKVLSGMVYAQRIRHYKVSAASSEWEERLLVLLRRLRISRPVKLLESGLIKSPAVVGWLKPVILVPIGMLAQLPADQVESILLHELAHISRRDYVFNIVQHIVDTVYFFNPALLWVSSLIRTERENCCDDVAIRETRSRRQLIQALVSFHEYQKSSGGYAMAFANEHGMVKRVERIVRKKNHSLNAGERLLLMVGVILLCGAFITINGGTGGTPPAPAVRPVVPPAPVVLKAVLKQPEPAKAPAAPSVVVLQAPAAPAVKRVAPAAPAIDVSDTAKQDSADVELIIRAHDHGVTAEYIAELKKLGYAVNLEQAIRLVDHGVTAEFLQSLSKAGFGVVTLDKAVKLLDHGVTVEFIRQVRALGFPDLTLEEAVHLIDHGVTADFIEKWKAKTGSKLALSDYIKLRDAGIDPS